MESNNKNRKLRKTNEKQGKPRPMENTEVVRKINSKTNRKTRKINGKQKNIEENEGKPMENKGKVRNMNENQRKTRK